MSTRARFDLVDSYDTTPLRDLSPAEASALPRLSHALMSGWGGCAQGRSFMRYTNTTTVTSTISYRCPPGVYRVDIACLMCGAGVVKFTSSIDPTGTEMRTHWAGAGTEVMESAVWQKTNGDIQTDGMAVPGASTQRALDVVASETWDWTNVDITVELNPDGSSDLYVFALAFYPIHVTN